MDDIYCPFCKTTRYRKPDLLLMVNVCGHSLCDACVNKLFVRGSGECPECKLQLRKTAFRPQQFEDSSVDKECEVRRKVLAVYNKKESDFSSLREYNDYLEEVETIIYNLSSGVDVENTRLKMEQYREENEAFIAKNRFKISSDEALLNQLIEEEREWQEECRKMALQEELQKQQDRQKKRDDLVDQLIHSDLPAAHIVQQHRKETSVKTVEPSAAVPHLLAPSQNRATILSSGVKIGGSQASFVPIKHDEPVAELYQHQPLEFNFIGPQPPSALELLSNSYLTHVCKAGNRELAGGFESIIACRRAIEDAFCGLLFVAPDVS